MSVTRLTIRKTQQQRIAAAMTEASEAGRSRVLAGFIFTESGMQPYLGDEITLNDLLLMQAVIGHYVAGMIDTQDTGESGGESGNLAPGGHTMFEIFKATVAFAARLSQNNPKLKPLIFLFVAVFVGSLFFVSRCAAADLSFEGGTTVVRGEAPVFGMVVELPGLFAKSAGVAFTAHLIGDSTFEGQHQNNQIAAGAIVFNRIGRFDIGLGLAKLQNDDAYNSGNINFELEVRWRVNDHLWLTQRHFSNAGSHFPNEGRDLTLVTYRF